MSADIPALDPEGNPPAQNHQPAAHHTQRFSSTPGLPGSDRVPVAHAPVADVESGILSIMVDSRNRDHYPSRLSDSLDHAREKWRHLSANESPLEHTDKIRTSRAIRLGQIALILTSVAAGVLAYFFSDAFRHEVQLIVTIMSQGDASALQEYIRSFGNWAPVISLALMVAQAIVAPLPSFLVTFANGLAFGAFWGWLLSLAGHALAAAVCFWIARAVGRSSVEALAGRTGLESADRWFARRGAYAIFLARLIPGVSFDAISYGAGLSRIGFRKFIVATVLGTLPQHFVYAYLGHSAPQYIWLLLAASMLSAIVVTVAIAIARRRSRDSHLEPDYEVATSHAEPGRNLALFRRSADKSIRGRTLRPSLSARQGSARGVHELTTSSSTVYGR